MSTWANRIIGHGEEAPDDLLAHPGNWRIHPQAQQEALSGAIKDIGFIRSVTVNRRTGHVLDGHLRVALAIRSGQASIPVEYVDLSPEEEAEALATLDPLAAMAVTDGQKLDELLRDIPAVDPAVMAMLDSLAQRAGIVPGVEVPTPEPQKEPQLRGECFIEICCTQRDLEEFRATLHEWGGRTSVTINIS